MIRWIITSGLIVCAAVGGALYMRHITRPAAAPPRDTFRQVSRQPAPTIEQVRELALLVTLDVPISDVHVSELEGMTGGVKLVMAVYGDVQIGANLDQARFEDMDEQQRTVTLVVPRPTPTRPRLDHRRTRILEMHRSGLWRFLPGQAGEKTLTNRAFAAAQATLAQAAQQPDLLAKACGRTERVLGDFFKALGWQVIIQWDDAPKPVDDPATAAVPTSTD